MTYEPTPEDHRIEHENRLAVQSWLFNIFARTYAENPADHYRGFRNLLTDEATALLPVQFEEDTTITDEFGAVFLPRRPREER